MYLTPRASRAVPAHSDDQDVLILQLAGEKEWTVYGSPIELPYSHEQLGKGMAVDRASLGEPLLQTVLKPGGVLYLPRGFVHEARANEAGSSLHITLTVQTSDLPHGTPTSGNGKAEHAYAKSDHDASGTTVFLRPHEELLRREEVAWCKEFAARPEESPPISLKEIRAEVAAQRKAEAALEAALPTEMVIGMFSVAVGTLRASLVAKHRACVEQLLLLVAERAREECAVVCKAFGEMHTQVTGRHCHHHRLLPQPPHPAPVPRGRLRHGGQGLTGSFSSLTVIAYLIT